MKVILHHCSKSFMGKASAFIQYQGYESSWSTFPIHIHNAAHCCCITNCKSAKVRSFNCLASLCTNSKKGWKKKQALGYSRAEEHQTAALSGTKRCEPPSAPLWMRLPLVSSSLGEICSAITLSGECQISYYTRSYIFCLLFAFTVILFLHSQANTEKKNAIMCHVAQNTQSVSELNCSLTSG